MAHNRSDLQDKDQTGFSILNNAATNRSVAFSREERERYGLRGLLPAKIFTQAEQMDRVHENLRRKDNDLERYIFLFMLQSRNERLFFKTLIESIDELLPIVYTPTVGEACKQFAHIFRQPRGFYITADDRGDVARILKNWPAQDVRVIVITDGERILGLGDLGSNGMGIPIGKVSLYTACAGIDPQYCMPVMFDIGTNNQELLDEPLYLGAPTRRLSGDLYFGLMDEFVEAVQQRFPKALIQFEDFLTPNAYALLRRYRDRILCFNDDIQGTAGIALAGLLAATRITGVPLVDHRIMFLGAGSAATGIADLMVLALMAEGLSESDARARCWFVDSKGLVVKSRDDLAEHKLPFAHDHQEMDFESAIESIKPHVLIGATGRGGTFTQSVIERMAKLNERPVIFALSNPTSRSECTAEQAYLWSEGRVVFASGSPFPAIETKDGKIWKPGQSNNVYIFPGIGLGAIGCEASRLSDQMFLVAARTLAGQVSEESLKLGTLFPPLTEIRQVSLAIATAVAEEAYKEGVARTPRPSSIRDHLAGQMYDPSY